MNKETKLNKLTNIPFVIPKKHSAFIYIWSTNINVQVNNSYKINLKVIKYK